MPPSRVTAAVQSFGLGAMTGLVVTAVVRRPAALSPVGFTAVVSLVGFVAVAALRWRRHEAWASLGPTVGFALFFGSLFVGVVVLAGPVGILLGGGTVTTVVQLLASAVAFAGTAWVCFFGGARTVVTWVAPRLGVEL
ncbi:hypothetical protein GJ629_14660 [Halapricum sp. CBA1109]|uniref:hypothetical protein n=1 Tax=Halapricum sp. CBA1109 TaxID=2668068 RepID=UPI0012F8063D|nr:hypothetical protein [Halapricum sp. CBA1109]MUV90977.1 hypothetical protein [Halapricum sp. CBA1109]